MSDFTFFFGFGWDHIISWKALDHLLFIFALTVACTFTEWKKLLVLVTAFTIGHSITLALSVLDIARFPTKWTEFFIPLTIAITCIINIARRPSHSRLIWQYILALCFGFIHGMGFANSIRFMLTGNQQLGWSLLEFNAGLEAGQLIVVLVVLFISYLVTARLKVPSRWWILTGSTAALLISVFMAAERWPR